MMTPAYRTCEALDTVRTLVTALAGPTERTQWTVRRPDDPTSHSPHQPGTRSVARCVRSGVCVLVRARVGVRVRARARVRVGVAVGRVRPGRSSRAAGVACTWWSPGYIYIYACTWWSPGHEGVSKVVSSWPPYYLPRVRGGRLRTSTLSVHGVGACSRKASGREMHGEM